MINRVVIQGRNVAEPSFGNANNGNNYANFRIAWSEKYKDHENKAFIDCRAFGTTASFIQKWFGKKGQEMLIEGRLQTEEWTTKDGDQRSKLVLMVDKVHFAGKREDGGETGGSIRPNLTPVEMPVDELPF